MVIGVRLSHRHPRIFSPPAPIERALEFANALRAQPNAVIVSPGARHWEIFERLCLGAGAKGNLVADAYLAALAIESGSEWITTDRDFSRFPGLRCATRSPKAETRTGWPGRSSDRANRPPQAFLECEHRERHRGGRPRARL